MKRGITKGALLLVTLLFMFGCASTNSADTAREPQVRNVLEGRTIGVMSFPAQFSSLHFTIDLRDVKITIGGQPVVLQDKYLKIYDDSNVGKLGILEANFLRLTGADIAAIENAVNEEWVAGLSGATDYHLGFFNGLGEGNMGEISNRPLIYDQSGYPMKVSYSPAEGPLSYFSSIEKLPEGTEAGTVKKDFILKGSLDINNEVVEITAFPKKSPSTH